tara:strand:- start:814 stop:1509 length:696 start_codon:yes stop_codon:yes gene_type:complete
MRHRKKFNHLGRKAAHRKAMLSNMACSLIEHKRIKTTLAKAKALRVYVEPLITKSKNDTTHSRRTVFSYLKQKEAITELFGDIATKVSDRPGGYTRIIKLNNRLGDNAQMAYIELVDYNEIYITDKPKKKKTRRRGATKSASSTPVLKDAENVEIVNEKTSKVEDSTIDAETTLQKVEETKEEESTVEKIETEPIEESKEEQNVENTEEKIETESEKKDDSNETLEEEKAD